MKRRRSAKWAVARKMPPLKHSPPGQAYDVAQSEAARWLARRPEIMQLVFEAVKDHGDIVYDSASGVWVGADYEA